MEPNHKPTTSAHYLRGFGCYVQLLDGVLMQQPDLSCSREDYVKRHGGPPEWDEVTAVAGMAETLEDDQAYLDAVNTALGSSFKLSDFAGR